jgi:hypothetical protein
VGEQAMSKAGISVAPAPVNVSAAPRPSELAEHFDTLPQQLDPSQLWMWIFLAMELLLFGGLFCVYAVFRGRNPELFTYGHRYLDVGCGAINTVVLIFSSFTMAMAVWAAQTNQRRDLVLFLSLTLLGGPTSSGSKWWNTPTSFTATWSGARGSTKLYAARDDQPGLAARYHHDPALSLRGHREVGAGP